MKIKELINKMQTLDPEMEIIVYHEGCGFACHQSGINFVDNTGIVSASKIKNSQKCLIISTLT
jgi:hypothetical protein